MKLNMDNRFVKWMMNETNFVTYIVSAIVLFGLSFWAVGLFISMFLGSWFAYPYFFGSWFVLYKVLRPYVADTTEYNPEEN